jgi:hypothetical protein
MKKPTLHSMLMAIALSLGVNGNAQLVNLGLVGVGRSPADSSDTLGPNVDTLGGIFSGLRIDPSALSKSGDTFSGPIFGLPDRGFGDGLTDYHPRLQRFDFSVTPYYGPYPAPSQNQLTFVNTATLVLSVNGSTFTGYNPDDTNVLTHPQSPADSPGAGKWSLDTEGIARTPNGWYVSDEYGPFIYHFSDNGVLLDVLVPPPALIPKSGPTYPRQNNFGVIIPQVPTNDSGRYVNRGLEGLSATPDGKKLVSILQSPCIQDGENRNPSRNTRILIFDVDPTSPTYNQPIAEYVYVCTLNAAEARNRHTPISEILALSDTRFLVLERDSRGRGGDLGPILYKKVVLADVSAASNIINTGYDLEKGAPGQLSLPRTTLPTNIVAAARKDLVDIADPKQLAKFGLNVNTNWDNNTLCEKWEGLGVIPLNDPAAPNDYLIIVGNDNDFKAPLVYHNGQVVGTNDITIDNMLLAFRVGEDHIPPQIVCPGPTTLAANSNCMAAVDLRSRVVGTDNSAEPVTILQTPPPGTLLPKGTHTITFIGQDAAGNRSEPCSAIVNITDQTPPAIVSLTPNPKEISGAPYIWVPVSLSITAVDNCDPNPQSRIIRVTSNQPLSGSEDEDNQAKDHGRASDWQITGPLTVALRPILSSPQRVYFITVETTDNAGNTSTAVTTVTVKSKQSITPGFLTSVKPYALPVGPDYTIIPLISSGDRVPRTGQPALQYQIVGIPDGLGAHRNSDGTLSIYMNHELVNLARSEPRWGEPLDSGALVSKLIIAPDGSVLSGDRAYQNVFVDNNLVGPAATISNSTPPFTRFCSGHLVWQEAGFDRPIYFCGEESGGTNTFDGQGGSLAAIFDNELHVLTKAPRIAWENAAVRPQSGPLTVMMCLEDGPEGPDSQLLMYVGVKDRRSGASPLRRNGLDNGQLFVFVAESQTRSNEVVFQTGSLRGHWELVPDAASLNDVELDEAEKAVGAFGFIRIEDGAFTPGNPNEFHFVTTGGAPGNLLGRLYRLNLNRDNILGTATLTVVYNADQVIAAGSDIAVSPDNVGTSENFVMVCEDGTAPSRPVMGSKGRQGNIWRFDWRNNYSAQNVATLARSGRDGIPTGPGVWETSGIIPMTSLIGQDIWLFNVQAHAPSSAPGRNTVEDGQLLLMIRNR